MRRTFGVVLLALLVLIEVTPSFGGSIQLPSTYASWVDTVNYYRQSSGLSPITEDKSLSAAVQKHLTYLTMSDPKYFTGRYVSRHLENPASPYYSISGANSGQELSTTLTGSQSQSVDLWMASPFHAMGFMREGLQKVGWASAYSPRTGFYDAGADVLDRLKPRRTKIVTFPGNGSYSRMDNFPGESPDPRESCGVNGKIFTGLPLWVSLKATPPRSMSAEIITPARRKLSSRTQLCIVNEFNMKTTDPIYGSAGKAIVRADHMVMIIPKDPLTPGLQRVSLSLTGHPKISWSFTVIARPADIALTTMDDPTSISWDAPLSLPANPTVGYDVLVADSTMKRIETFKTTTNTFSTTGLSAGNYWVCIRAVGKYRNGDCPNYFGYKAGKNPS